MLRRLPVLASTLVLALGAAACGEDDEAGTAATPASTPTPTPTATPSPEGDAASGGCEPVEAPAPKRNVDLPRPDEKLEAGTTYVAEVQTNCGTFEITLDPESSPRTGGSFKYLADENFFDGTTFHRIVRGFVIQGGDPRGKGSGGPGYSVVEAPPDDLVYERGVVAMAKTGFEDPGTSGSQFFVVTAEDAQLPPEYALVGRITAGQDVVDRIGVSEIDPATEQPVEPVVIESVTVTES